VPPIHLLGIGLRSSCSVARCNAMERNTSNHVTLNTARSLATADKQIEEKEEQRRGRRCYKPSNVVLMQERDVEET
jgi:hypothetical protein